MKKRILSLAFALTIALSCAPFAGAAVSSSDAQAYIKKIDQTHYYQQPYLVDFDGDGRDELLIVWDRDEYGKWLYETHCEVWSGAKRIVSASAQGDYWLQLYENKNMPGKKFLAYIFECDGCIDITTYTVSSGRWVKVDTFYALEDHWAQIEHRPDTSEYNLNGEKVSRDTFNSERWAYEAWDDLEGDYDDKAAVRTKLVNSINPTVAGYSNILSTLSRTEKTELFDQFLSQVATLDLLEWSTEGDGINCKTASDAEFLDLLEDLDFDCGFFDPLYSSKDDFAIRPADLTKFTQKYFGRTINYSKCAINHYPTWDDLNRGSVYYNGEFYFARPDRGGDVSLAYMMCTPRTLYSLGSGWYSTSFVIEFGEEVSWVPSAHYTAVVKKNIDGSWMLQVLYPANYIPTTAELSAFVAPSSWAKAEVEAADAAGLIPDLTGDPGWQDASTRLQFCQLAVQLAETALGETLPAASANTFTDCSDLAVRKAYAAKIVNGMTETTFSPNGTLTREQLATMLWRAVNYIQTQSGEQTLTGGGSLTGYTDAGSVSSYAKDAVAALNKHGIMKGTSNTALSPKGSCTVEQSVLLSYRTFLKLN